MCVCSLATDCVIKQRYVFPMSLSFIRFTTRCVDSDWWMDRCICTLVIAYRTIASSAATC